MIFNLQTDTLIPTMNLLAHNDSEYLLIDSLINGAEFNTTSHATAPKKRSECLVPKSNPKLNVHVSIKSTKRADDNDSKNVIRDNGTHSNIRSDYDCDCDNDSDNDNDNENDNENNNDTNHNNYNEGNVGQVKSLIK